MDQTTLASSALDEESKRNAKIINVFFPYMSERVAKAKSQNTKFVHYTTADTAKRIFESKQVWMRKSSCMNDFMEIQHGRICHHAAYTSNRDRMKSILDSIFPDFCEKLEKQLDTWSPLFIRDTYLACISEHGDEQTGDEEDRIGRLSMWRAYGGNAGVAIVMNGTPFLGPSDALKAYTSPVAYLSVQSFAPEFSKLMENMEAEKELLTSMGEQHVLNMLFEAFRFAILCTKHPRFREEREWRIIYNPALAKSDVLIPSFESINGNLQPIVRIPLKNIPEEQLEGIEIPQLIERVIIGPTHYPAAMWEALVGILTQAGMQDADKKVFISDIPLRQVQ